MSGEGERTMAQEHRFQIPGGMLKIKSVEGWEFQKAGESKWWASWITGDDSHLGQILAELLRVVAERDAATKQASWQKEVNVELNKEVLAMVDCVGVWEELEAERDRYRALAGKLYLWVLEADHEPGCAYGEQRIPEADINAILLHQKRMPPDDPCTCGKQLLHADPDGVAALRELEELRTRLQDWTECCARQAGALEEKDTELINLKERQQLMVEKVRDAARVATEAEERGMPKTASLQLQHLAASLEEISTPGRETEALETSELQRPADQERVCCWVDGDIVYEAFEDATGKRRLFSSLIYPWGKLAEHVLPPEDRVYEDLLEEVIQLRRGGGEFGSGYRSGEEISTPQGSTRDAAQPEPWMVVICR